ncbi:hypothetical protein NC652_011478 [Populus alba x Populus x berolinensis]|nr:hypothetical protein NC652_011478 [Populus alba x Populus x berolinensis]
MHACRHTIICVLNIGAQNMNVTKLKLNASSVNMKVTKTNSMQSSINMNVTKPKASLFVINSPHFNLFSVVYLYLHYSYV